MMHKSVFCTEARGSAVKEVRLNHTLSISVCSRQCDQGTLDLSLLLQSSYLFTWDVTINITVIRKEPICWAGIVLKGKCSAWRLPIAIGITTFETVAVVPFFNDRKKYNRVVYSLVYCWPFFLSIKVLLTDKVASLDSNSQRGGWKGDLIPQMAAILYLCSPWSPLLYRTG